MPLTPTGPPLVAPLNNGLFWINCDSVFMSFLFSLHIYIVNGTYHTKPLFLRLFLNENRSISAVLRLFVYTVNSGGFLRHQSSLNPGLRVEVLVNPQHRCKMLHVLYRRLQSVVFQSRTVTTVGRECCLS